jgi:hypothetical protein
MKDFDYIRPATIREAVSAATEPGAAYLAAGTNLLDLMKGGITKPDRLIDITHLPGLDHIEDLSDGSVRIGTLVRNSDLAHNRNFAGRFSGGSRSGFVRCFCAASQRCDSRRQSSPTNALCVFLRHRERLQ